MRSSPYRPDGNSSDLELSAGSATAAPPTTTNNNRISKSFRSSLPRRFRIPEKFKRGGGSSKKMAEPQQTITPSSYAATTTAGVSSGAIPAAATEMTQYMANKSTTKERVMTPGGRGSLLPTSPRDRGARTGTT